MPQSCFSYRPDVPPDTGKRHDLPTAPRAMGEMGPCFSMPAGLALGGLRRMPVGPCFTYAASRTTRPGFTGATCFRY